MFNSEYIHEYFEEVSLEIGITLHRKGNFRCIFRYFSAIFGLSRVSSAIFAGETHDD